MDARMRLAVLTGGQVLPGSGMGNGVEDKLRQAAFARPVEGQVSLHQRRVPWFSSVEARLFELVCTRAARCAQSRTFESRQFPGLQETLQRLIAPASTPPPRARPLLQAFPDRAMGNEKRVGAMVLATLTMTYCRRSAKLDAAGAWRQSRCSCFVRGCRRWQYGASARACLRLETVQGEIHTLERRPLQE